MGSKNRQRRAAKAQQRVRDRARADRTGWDQRAREPQHGGSGRPRPDRELVDAAFRGAVDARVRGATLFERQAMDVLAMADDHQVVAAAAGELRRALPLLWDGGWQPAELVREARRRSSFAARLVTAAVLADHAHRSEATLDPRWAAQVTALADTDQAAHGVAADPGWLAAFASKEPASGADLSAALVAGTAVCFGLGRLAVLLPPPGSAGSTAAAGASVPPPGIDDAVLAKVRALLAQAESTTFEAEAEAFTAKAQELMARHAIDTALVWERAGRDERPVTIRLPVDEPYVDAKAQLLHVVAQHSRCRAVQMTHYALVSVTGFASDVASVEVLFTSLLVQSQVAMRAEGAAAGPGSRARSRSFRSSFLAAYAVRIGERLAAVNDAVSTEASGRGETGADLLPVLAARAEAVDGAVAELYGTLRTSRARGAVDPFGWARGRDAADRAQLRAGDLAEGRRALGA